VQDGNRHLMGLVYDQVLGHGSSRFMEMLQQETHRPKHRLQPPRPERGCAWGRGRQGRGKGNQGCVRAWVTSKVIVGKDFLNFTEGTGKLGNDTSEKGSTTLQDLNHRVKVFASLAKDGKRHGGVSSFSAGQEAPGSQSPISAQGLQAGRRGLSPI
jgi:hypothetical protein